MVDVVKTNTQYNENAFEVQKLLIYSNSGGEPFDIANMNAFLELSIYESIFDEKIYGEILLRDALNLSETLPIVGNERVEIYYRTGSEAFDFVKISGFVTAPLGKARIDGEKTEVYKLQFISDTNFLNRFLTVDYSLNGTISQMISSLFTNYFGSSGVKLFTNTATKEIHRFIVPRWTPLFTASWLASRAFSPSKHSMYLFYEDVDGFHFKDVLQEMLKTEKYIFRVEPRNAGNLGDVMSYMTMVHSYSIASYYDRIDEFHEGMYSGILNTHDITKKKFNQYEFDYLDYASDSQWKSLNKYPLIPPNKSFELYRIVGKQNNRNFVPVQTKKTNQIEDNDQYEKYYLRNKSIRKQLTAHMMSIEVAGNSSLRLLDTVGFEIPKIGYLDDSNGNYLDPYLSGKYIVVSLKHVLNRVSGYKTMIDMSKESLLQPIPNSIEKTVYR